MLSKTSLGIIAALYASAALLVSPVFAASEPGPLDVGDLAHQPGSHENPEPKALDWSFAGIFGKYDQAQLQRGFKVFREVCSSCHSVNDLSFRNLAQPGGPRFSEAQVKALAAEYKIKDGPNDAGEMFDRPGRPSDHWPAPFANANAARAANGGGLPPDMSVLAKARTYHKPIWRSLMDALPGLSYQEQGPDYMAALLTGYAPPPKGVKLDAGQNWNLYMPGNRIAMANPLSDGQVEYTDGTAATAKQYATDVSAFLMWVAEPHLEARKRTGFRVIIFLMVLAGLLYFVKKRIWSNVAH